MKAIKILVLSFILFGSVSMASASVSVSESASATATATATIIAPITIARNTNLAFGNILPGSVDGTVVLSPLGIRTATGVTLPPVTGSVSAAIFTVTGAIGTNFDIALPTSITLTSGTAGVNSMEVNNFVSTPNGSGILNSGNQALSVGGTLNVKAGQASGYYTADFVVTVNIP